MVKETKILLKRQSGLSLIELLVALGLGIFILAGIMQVFVGSRQSFDVIRSQTAMQEAGRFGADFVSRALRHAGYINEGAIDSDFAANMVNVAQLTYADRWPTQNGFQEEAIVMGTNGANAGEPDSVTLRLQGDPDLAMFDCEGIALTADPTQIVRMTFSVNTATNELVCQVFDGAVMRPAVALVSGVEDMQVMYGVATVEEQPHLIGKYVNAGDIAADEWRSVVAVRVGLLTVSDNAPLSREDIEYTILDEAYDKGSDGRARQVFTQTVALRSKLSG